MIYGIVLINRRSCSMKKLKNIKQILKKYNKVSLWVYFFLRVLVILCMIRELYRGNFENALLCILSLILFLLPVIVEKTFKVDLPPTLEVIILVFIFSAEILGEINNFYGQFPNFDDILHTINGFLAASVGFSLVYLLNENTEKFHLSPIFVAIVAFCFSMTIGVFWEFFEYGMDQFVGLDMQKDSYVETIRTVTLDPEQSNQVVTFDDISKTVLYDESGNEIMEISHYLDIGLHDTMQDLFVNFIGAFVFSVFGYLYILNQKQYKIAGVFLTKRMKRE